MRSHGAPSRVERRSRARPFFLHERGPILSMAIRADGDGQLLPRPAIHRCRPDLGQLPPEIACRGVVASDGDLAHAPEGGAPRGVVRAADELCLEAAPLSGDEAHARIPVVVRSPFTSFSMSITRPPRWPRSGGERGSCSDRAAPPFGEIPRDRGRERPSRRLSRGGAGQPVRQASRRLGWLDRGRTVAIERRRSRPRPADPGRPGRPRATRRPGSATGPLDRPSGGARGGGRVRS